jgi:AcrR family transcriptional regulator
MSVRGEQTRENLLDAAEQLFGERGVAGVSLREIRIASGARNTGALQFHFGDRNGLLDALTARHLPRIGALQQQYYDDVVAEGRLEEPRALVEVLVRPVTEYLATGPSERAWVKIMAELGTAPEMRLIRMVTFAPNAALAAGNALYERLEQSLPGIIAAERMVITAQSMVHVCADRARLIDDPTRSTRAVSNEVFLQNLIDMTWGALSAPMGESLRRLLADG